MVFRMEVPGEVVGDNVDVCLGAPTLSSAVVVPGQAQTNLATAIVSRHPATEPALLMDREDEDWPDADVPA